MRLLPSTSVEHSRRLGSDLWTIFLWVVAVVAGEVLGRRSPNDLVDSLALLVGLSMVLFTFGWRQKGRFALIERIYAAARSIKSFLQRQAVQIGVDFRLDPPIPTGFPPILRWNLLGFALATSALFLLRSWLPTPARELSVRHLYVGYLIILGVLWSALLIGVLLLLFAPLAMIHDAFVNRWTGDRIRKRKVESLFTLAYLLTLAIAGFLTPPWLPSLLFVSFSLFAALAILWPGNPDLRLLWKRKNARRHESQSSQPLASTSFRRLVASQVMLFTLIVVALVELSRGELLFRREYRSPEMPITTTLGLVFCWSAVGGSLVLLLQVVRVVRLAHSLNPARYPELKLHVDSALHADERTTLTRVLARAGWQVSYPPSSPSDGDVRVTILPETANPPDPWDSTAPARAFKLPDLTEVSTLRRLKRRREIQLRRKILRGLEKLFKVAARRKYKKGHGFWIGLQHWFILGLSRDITEDETDLEHASILDDTIGPPYHRLFPQPARNCFFQVMNALELDLIFVEDGVSYRRFQRVLRYLFEHYDLFADRQRAEEKHFVGIPGIRVLIHYFQLDAPLLRKDYPEPDYEDVGRARILHVFKDRGENEEHLETPRDLRGIPVPCLTH